jgi:hypothetical protein
MDVYLGGMCGSPCCLVLTVSSECISISPVVPPMPPANIACCELISDCAFDMHYGAYMDVWWSRGILVYLLFDRRCSRRCSPLLRQCSIHGNLRSSLSIIDQMRAGAEVEEIGDAGKHHQRRAATACLPIPSMRQSREETNAPMREMSDGKEM